MRGRLGNIGRTSGLLPFALALMLLFRLAIPAGYMIAPDHQGRPGLALCATPAQAAAQAALHDGHDGDTDAPAPSGTGERPCAFAALGAPPLPTEPPAVPPQAPAERLAQDRPAASNPPRVAPAAAPPPATGPPTTV